MRALVDGARRRARGRGSCDLGAASVEYVATILVVGLTISVVLASLLASQPRIREGVEYAICKVFTLLQGDCGGSDQAIDREPPPCVVSSDGGEVSVTAGVVLFGEGGEVWLIEQLGDGRYRVIEGVAIAGGAQGGAGGKIEVTINDQSYGGEAGLSGSAKIGIKACKTYYADDLEGAKDLLGRMRYETGVPGPIRTGLGWLNLGPDNLPEPDSTWVEAGMSLEGAGSAKAGFANVSGAAALEGALGTEVNKDGTATVYLSGSISAKASISVGHALLGDRSQGKHAAEGSYLDFDTVQVAAGADGKVGVTAQVDYDAGGNATSVRMTSTMGWSAEVTAKLFGVDLADQAKWGSTTDTTIELPLNTEADRETAAKALAAFGMPYVPGVTDGFQLPTLNPLEAADAMGDFAKAAFDHGKVWKDTYTSEESTKFGIAVEAAFEGKINIGGSYVTNNRTSLDSRYWAGTPWVERPECSAAA